MKRFLLVLFALPLLFTACENVLPTDGADIAVLTESKINTEPVLYEGKVVDTDYFVSPTTLNAYLELQPNRNGKKREVRSIEPTGPNADETLMYVVNYEGGGWEIISADKRTEAILACSDEGSFSWEKANPGKLAWMGGIGEGLLHLRTAGPDAKLTEKATKEKEQNVNFWDGLELTKAFIDINGADALKDAVPATEEELRFIKASQTRWGGNSGSGEEGHYELVSSIQSERYDTVTHLLDTTKRWNQHSPWNSCCPVIGGTTTLVGCTPLAAAQILYYLHDAIGVPQNALLGEDFYEDYPNLNDSTVWGSMEVYNINDHAPITAKFLRVVGDMCGAEYGAVERPGGVLATPAVLDNLRFDLFAPYGVSSSNCVSYESSIVIGALKQPIPIPTLVSAYSKDPANPADSVGHAFVIDGYIDATIITTNVYEWVGGLPFDPTQIIMPNPRVVETVEGPTYTRKICMSWGWNDENNDEWYTPNGSWVTTITEIRDGGFFEESYYDYVHARKMITNFGILNH